MGKSKVLISVEMPEVYAFAKNLEGLAFRDAVLNRVLKRMGREIMGRARKNIRKKTGHTGQGISVDELEALKVAVVSHNVVGLFLEFGTKAHEIAAKNAQALMLQIAPHAGTAAGAGKSIFGRTYGRSGTSRLTGSPRSGQVAFFKSVHHPGARAYPFLMPAYRESLPVLREVLLVAGDQIVRKMAGKGEISIP